MTKEHPITPPPELVQQWLNAPRYTKTPKDGTFLVQKCHSLSESEVIALVENAACWGADQELEACCKWLKDTAHIGIDFELLHARRSKPPSLKETLLARVARIPGEGADAAYLRHWVDNESQRLVDLLHEVFKSLPD